MEDTDKARAKNLIKTRIHWIQTQMGVANILICTLFVCFVTYLIVREQMNLSSE